MRFLAALFGVIIAFVFFLTLSTSYTVDEGERGVLLRNGAVVGTTEPGRGFKVPIIDSVRYIPVNQQSVVWSGETALQAYSQDQQAATMAVSVIYHIPSDQVETVYAEYGSVDGLQSRLLDRVIPQQLKTVFGRFNAVASIQQRDRLNAEVQKAVLENVKGPLIIDSIQIENIDYSDAYEQSIEARMLAEVEVQRVRQNADREKVAAEITVTQAQAAADAQRAEAQARADAIRMAGEAEAAAIEAKGKALRDNPALIEFQTIGKGWDGKLPATMIPGSAVPFVGVK
jgi:regulator of protease activity HflC (stomatin/prohibitin superfamily)